MAIGRSFTAVMTIVEVVLAVSVPPLPVLPRSLMVVVRMRELLL